MRPLASIYRGRWLADLTGKGHSPVVALGYENRQEVDPAWLPVRARCAAERASLYLRDA